MGKEKEWIAESAVVYRTARRLMEGVVFVRASKVTEVRPRLRRAAPSAV